MRSNSMPSTQAPRRWRRNVKTEHGILPSRPAYRRIAQKHPDRCGPLPFELLTPTAAAVLTSFVTSFGLMPPMSITATGYGAGSRDSDRSPMSSAS